MSNRRASIHLTSIAVVWVLWHCTARLAVAMLSGRMFCAFGLRYDGSVSVL